jgi:hypothetical protein
MELSKESGMFWDEDKGPLENLFGLVEMGAVGLPGISGKMKLLVVLASLFGMGAAEFGKYLDEKLGFDDVDDIKKMDALDAATEFTIDVFDITDEELEKAATQYAIALKKTAHIEKTANRARALKRLMGMKGGHKNAGLIATTFNKVFSVFSWAWSALKAVILGGLGVLALKGTDIIHDDRRPDKAKERERKPEHTDDDDFVSWSVSTKDSANAYRKKLETRIDNILTR